MSAQFDTSEQKPNKIKNRENGYEKNKSIHSSQSKPCSPKKAENTWQQTKTNIRKNGASNKRPIAPCTNDMHQQHMSTNWSTSFELLGDCAMDERHRFVPYNTCPWGVVVAAPPELGQKGMLLECKTIFQSSLAHPGPARISTRWHLKRWQSKSPGTQY